MKAVGIDGCPGGWIAARAEEGCVYSIELVPHLQFLKTNVREEVWIDMPIGLPSAAAYPRKAEKEARKLLKTRASSVFSVPCREVLQTAGYHEANRLHRELTGKGISRQSWYLLSKIKEAEVLANRMNKMMIREAHPELVFYGLSGKAMDHSKKKSEGRRERLNVLKAYFPDAEKQYEAAVGRWLRKEAAKDDVIDAMGLAVAAAHPDVKRKTVLPEDEPDETGLGMNISYSIRKME
jgi:predicted RNase H-like nuclease